MRCIKIIWHHIFFIHTETLAYRMRKPKWANACSLQLMIITNHCEWMCNKVTEFINTTCVQLPSYTYTTITFDCGRFYETGFMLGSKGAEEYSFEIKNQPTAKKIQSLNNKKTIWRNMHLNSVPIHNRIEHLFHDSWISFDVLSFFSINTCPFEKYSSRRNAQQKQIHEFVLHFFVVFITPC